MEQEQRPEAGTRLSAVEIHENVLEPGLRELERPTASLLWSAIASGLVIGFSFLASGFAASVVPAPYKHAATSAAYPLGFILVIIARSELFTENTLTPIIPLLERRDRRTFVLVLRLWALLLVGNLIGTLAFGVVAARTAMVDPALQPELLRIAADLTTGSWLAIFYGAIFAGWLIALLGWLLASTMSTGAQIVLIWLCTAPIAAFGFRHSIAGAVEAFYRAAAGGAGWGEMFGGFIVPAVLGNAVGGVLLVALLNYGQVAPERPAGPRRRLPSRRPPPARRQAG